MQGLSIMLDCSRQRDGWIRPLRRTGIEIPSYLSFDRPSVIAHLLPLVPATNVRHHAASSQVTPLPCFSMEDLMRISGRAWRRVLVTFALPMVALPAAAEILSQRDPRSASGPVTR